MFCLDSTEREEFESIGRGYRKDIYVEILDEVFHLNVYTIKRLGQDFESELAYYGYYAPDPNLVLVEEVSNLAIKNLINQLHNQKYFEDIQPVKRQVLAKLELKEL